MEESHLQWRGKLVIGLRRLEIDANPASLRKTLDKNAEGGNQAEFVKHRGMQKVRKRSNLMETLAGQRNALRKGRARFQIKGLVTPAEDIQVHQDRRDMLRRSVMQFLG